MAQQTRSGNVYVISNVGSFGEGLDDFVAAIAQIDRHATRGGQ